LDPRPIREDTGVNCRSVGNGTSPREPKVDQTVLVPSVTELALQRTAGVAVARALAAPDRSGAYHARFDVLLEVRVQITTSIPVHYRYRDLSQHAVASRTCTRIQLKLKAGVIAFNGGPFQSYGASPAV